MILHADADSFYASVVQRDQPALRGRPVIVGGGVVLAASYEAKACGVRSGMGGARARRLCPNATVVRADFGAFFDAGRALLEVFSRAADAVEPLSMEEAFLDVGDAEDPRAIAEWVRAEARRQVGLPVSVGGGSTKIIAKMASRAAKPDGVVLVGRGRERAFLHPVPIDDLWGIGPKTARRLHDVGVRTVGDASLISQAAMIDLLGKGPGRHAYDLVHNRDRRPVEGDRPRRSVGAQRSLRRGGDVDLDATLAGLAERIAHRLERNDLAGRTVVLRLRFGDDTRATRSRTLAEPTASPRPVLAAARALLEDARPVIARRGLTLVGLTVGGLVDTSAGEQLELLVPAAEQEEAHRDLTLV